MITLTRFAWTLAITSSAWFLFALDRVFAAHGDLGSPGRFIAGVVPALWLAAALAAAGVLVALALQRTRIAQPRALGRTRPRRRATGAQMSRAPPHSPSTPPSS